MRLRISRDMHLCFVDESGTPRNPDQISPRYFVFGGLVIPEERWRGVRAKLDGLKASKKYCGEIKWRFFAPHNNDASNPMREWSQCRRNNFRNSVFRLVTSDRSLRIIAGVCDVPLAYGLGNVNAQEDIYFRTYKVVTERFQYLLQDVGRDSGSYTSGIIVADHRNGRQDHRMREQHERLVNETRQFTSTYGNFIESIFLSPSHMSVGIQFADMIAGAIWRFHEHGDSNWLDTIKPAFRTDKWGTIDGHGVARFPKRGWTGPTVQ